MMSRNCRIIRVFNLEINAFWTLADDGWDRLSASGWKFDMEYRREYAAKSAAQMTGG